MSLVSDVKMIENGWFMKDELSTEPVAVPEKVSVIGVAPALVTKNRTAKPALVSLNWNLLAQVCVAFRFRFYCLVSRAMVFQAAGATGLLPARDPANFPGAHILKKIPRHRGRGSFEIVS
jgi:hypothetical protein